MSESSSAARRLWFSLEPLHDVVYFAPEIRAAGVALGLRGFWMTYFAFRAAPLGPIGAEPVVSMFGGFHPAMVAKALPDAWSRTSPTACVATRAEVSAGVLRGLGVESAACHQVVAALGTVARSADPTGRSLYAANAAIPLAADPVAALWQVTTMLREHRGDGHVSALVAAGVSGLEAHLLQVATGRFPADVIRGARGWSESEWTSAADRLRGRGLLTADESISLSEAGRTLLADIERRTDEAAWLGGLSVVGESGVDEVVALLDRSVEAVVASGLLPASHPTGLPTRT